MKDDKTIEQVIAEEGVFVGTTVGISMEPLLHSRRDTIIVEKPKGRLKKNDVALYRRAESYVLHRVIEVRNDSYVILGDNCVNREYGITDAQIIGVLTAFYRKNRYYTVTSAAYRMYIALNRATRPFRIGCARLRGAAARCLRRFG